MTEEMASLPDVEHLPDGWIPVEMVAVLKCFDGDGEQTLCYRASEGSTPWEAIGMLQYGVDFNRKLLSEGAEEG